MNPFKKVETTIIISVSWLIFILFLLAFNPVGFSFWQNAACILASGVLATGLLALTWISPCPK